MLFTHTIYKNIINDVYTPKSKCLHDIVTKRPGTSSSPADQCRQNVTHLKEFRAGEYEVRSVKHISTVCIIWRSIVRCSNYSDISFVSKS